MKIVLQKDISNLGEAGDIKNVSKGYARNYLLPKKLVILANDANKKALLHQQKLIKIKKDKRRKQSEKLFDVLSNLELTFPTHAGEEGKLFGSVTSIDIAKKLKEHGFEIDKRKVLQDIPIKQLGRYTVPIRLHDGLTAEVTVNVVKG